jgi:hypothetical protein
MKNSKNTGAKAPKGKGMGYDPKGKGGKGKACK